MEFRRITPEDVDAVTEIAIRGMRPERHSGHLSREKVRAMVRHFCQSTSDWHLAAFEKGQVVGICAVQVSEQPWFERSQGIVTALFSAVPGVGWKLVREMFKWYSAQPMMRRLYWCLENDAGEQMVRVAKRFGFNDSATMMIHSKP